MTRNDSPLRVLWISDNASLQSDSNNTLSLTGNTERVVAEYCRDRIALAVAFDADGECESKVARDGILYYAVEADMRVGITEDEWAKPRAELLRIIDDFRPDIIQCFGSEWPFGAIARDVDIPVVIHLMGFLNIYYPSLDMIRRPATSGTRLKSLLRRTLRLLQRDRPRAPRQVVEVSSRTERMVMASNRYFMGRTSWDRNIVRYYSPQARYYHVEEAAKQPIYAAAGQWRYHYRGRLRLFTMSSADARKGNEIILRTARILKELLGLDFEWRIAGHKAFFPSFEQSTGIDRKDVNIELIGMIGSEQIVDELKRADYFVHPSLIDNSPNAVCEAQLVGCPVIASNVGGVSDLVENGITGFLYPYNEPHTLAFLIGNYLQEETLLNRLSANEVSTALARHNPATIADTLINTYAEIIHDYNGREHSGL